jgi:uncharacterized protein YbgA (DUF1722 family)/uncharacterized protein YbbK (DUF523 family)
VRAIRPAILKDFVTAMSPPSPAIIEQPVRIGVSSCLLGQAVRHDGQHKRDPFVCDVLAPQVQLIPICPEVELGLGVPREPIRLLSDGAGSRLVAVRTGRDLTREMTAWSERRARALIDEQLSGYILKKDSPSCGMSRVKRYPAAHAAGSPAPRAGAPARDGAGLFAAALARHLPNLPIEEEGRLRDLVLRDTFVESVFAYHRWRALRASTPTLGALVAFHTAHKLSLLAHAPAAYQALGRIIAGAKLIPRAALMDRYETGFMAALRKPATRGRHANVLQHMVGYFKKTLDESARRELETLVAHYQAGRVPLVAPLTLLRHHVKRVGVGYLAGQLYLEPPSGVRAIEARLAEVEIDRHAER